MVGKNFSPSMINLFLLLSCHLIAMYVYVTVKSAEKKS